jgi:aryl-alcohol dehydrogenase-like predicted oxidoreductase
MLETCKELGVAFVAYSPLGRGFLTGQIKKFEDLAEDDWRRHAPRFQGENFQKNLDIVSRLTELARRKGCTPSQLALAWVLTQDENIFPIPGTKRVKYLEENVAALNISFTSQELAEIDAIAPHGIAIGNRYPDAMMKTINQ